jgi:hypothetical protein
MIDKEIVKAIAAGIRQGKTAEFERLISSEEARAAGEQFGSWLHVAADYGQLEIVKMLCEVGFDINATNEHERQSPLLLAVRSGKNDVVEYLLTMGAQMDLSRPDSNPLFVAISADRPAIAKMLIDAGIDTRVKYRGTSGKIKDAHSYALDWGRKEIVKMIDGADVR